MKPFRPMLAATIEPDHDLSTLAYPLIGSPKVDGWRCIIHPELGPVTRSLKPIPNEHIRQTLNHPMLHGLDGEITIGPPNATNVFALTASACASYGGEPQFSYHIFDFVLSPDTPYHLRLKLAQDQAQRAMDESIAPVRILPHFEVKSKEDLQQVEEASVVQGFEGIMLRLWLGMYKYGRSTLIQQYLMKLKRFEDAEATIIGFEPLLKNMNEATVDNLGLQKRSTVQANKIPQETCGKLLVSSPNWQDFSIGSGLDSTLRKEIWDNRPAFLGKKLTFKFQRPGSIDKPRIPIFKAFRPEE